MRKDELKTLLDVVVMGVVAPAFANLALSYASITVLVVLISATLSQDHFVERTSMLGAAS